MRRIFIATSLLLFGFSVQAQENTNTSPFRQLGTMLPTPNEYRTASGAPGHAYWQQRADYKINVRLDENEQMVYGEETIDYFNRSPDSLPYLWIQLDQNIRAKDSDANSIEQSKIDERMTFENLRDIVPWFEGGFEIEYVRDTRANDIPYTINGTMMRVDLPSAVVPNGGTSLKIKWHYRINDRMKVGGRSGYEMFEEEDNAIYTIAQFYPRMVVYDDHNGWQHKQFLGNGEFTLTFGNFDVSITVPSDHILGATGVLQNAKDVLAAAKEIGADKAISSAAKILDQSQTYPVRKDLRKRCFALGDSLFKNIGSQLSVQKYGAKRGRGDFLDDIDAPLNNVGWMLSRFSEIRKMKTESSKLEAIGQILNRTNPGPGGFYDNFGSFNSWKRIVSPTTWAEDPGSNHSPIIDFSVSLKGIDKETVPLAWRSQITTHYNTPLELQYDNLDPKGFYVIKITYTGRFHSSMKLVADSKYLVHDFIQTGDQKAIYEFPVPPEALSDGVVKFTWTCDETGRGAQVAEVWLIKK